MIIDILLEASRILLRNGWTTHALARDANGASCRLDKSDAASYCLCGALTKAWRILDYENDEVYFRLFRNEFNMILESKYNYRYSLTQWNDSAATCKDDVIELIHDVISDRLNRKNFTLVILSKI
jgi:hypothetical protein